MRSSITIFFLVLMVSAHTPLGQLFKLPTFIEHFRKHNDKNGVSLAGFLQEHYSPNHNDADLPEDERLPFKNINIIFIGSAIMPGTVRMQSLAALTVNIKVILPEVYTPQQHLASIFHPPRV